ncbi:MAG: hypothetical protein ACFE95_08410 [Candidatus Hodarchaeota archaeon]
MVSPELEETLKDFIKAARRQNIGTANMLKSISDKLSLISKKEEDLIFLEKTKAEKLDELRTFLTRIEEVSNKENSTKDEPFNEIISKITPMSEQLDTLERNYKESIENISKLSDTNQNIGDQIEEIKDLLRTSEDRMNESFTQFQSIKDQMIPNIMERISDLEATILEVKNMVSDINLTSFMTPSEIIKDINIEGTEVQETLRKIPQQIIYKTEEDKISMMSIIDSLIFVFSGEETGLDELEGRLIRQLLISARSQVYDRTQGLAPRFRQAMDALLSLFVDEAIYPIKNLQSIVTSLQDLRKIYDSAPIATE